MWDEASAGASLAGSTETGRLPIHRKHPRLHTIAAGPTPTALQGGSFQAFLFWLPRGTWNYQAGDQIRAAVATYTRAAAIKDYRDSANPVVPQRELPDPILREMHASSESITHL